LRNVKRQNPETGTSTKVSDTGSWSQESRLFITGPVPKLRNAKNTFWCRFRIPGVGVSKHFTTRILKCRNAEMRKKTFWCRFHIPGVGVLKHFTTGIPKCWNAKMKKTPFGADFGYCELEVSKHFTTGMSKCWNVKMRKTPFGASFRFRELEMSKHFTTGMSKCRNAEMRNRQRTLWINTWSQLWACEGRSLQVARLHFVIGSWKSQSDLQQIRET
jgi:hypothetical protein